MSCSKRKPVVEICSETKSECCGDVCLFDENVSACKYGVDVGKINNYLIVCVEDYQQGLPRIEKVIGARSKVDAMYEAQRDYPKYKDIKVYDWIY